MSSDVANLLKHEWDGTANTSWPPGPGPGPPFSRIPDPNRRIHQRNRASPRETPIQSEGYAIWHQCTHCFGALTRRNPNNTLDTLLRNTLRLWGIPPRCLD